MKDFDQHELIVLPSGWQLCRLLALLCLFLLLCSPLLAPLEDKFHQLVWQQPVSLQLVLSSLTSNAANVKL
ncbi:hypothetical protein A5320_18770 [Rheinheimera sp. SA_1]|jgi:hypothetical protein|uniref:hypothetical protein n=1 Tax=Rheinheimera sp. SA_1 TaxID=1827365 RepID=UPI0007FE87BA|nr:hypothetical protein [Rheinheimera sp. SA_1]OBP13357.1 hypothetical protein A5320_18770 [Rheinheimera sp. SA_1]